MTQREIFENVLEDYIDELRSDINQMGENYYGEMKARKMKEFDDADSFKIFVTAGDWKSDWTSGVAVVLANNEDEARELLKENNKGLDTRISECENCELTCYEIDQPFVVVDEYGGG